MSTGLLFQSAFCWPCKVTTGKIVPMEGYNLAVCMHLVWVQLSVPQGAFFEDYKFCEWTKNWKCEETIFMNLHFSLIFNLCDNRISTNIRWKKFCESPKINKIPWIYSTWKRVPSVHACLGLVLENWPFVVISGYNNLSKLCHLCHLTSLLKPLPPTNPTPHDSCPLWYNIR